MAIPPRLVLTLPEAQEITNTVPAPEHKEQDSDGGIPYGKIALFALGCVVWNAAFTRRGRARLSRGELPESILTLPVFLLIARTFSAASGRSGSNEDTGRRRGTFDGGGASGNW